MSSDSEFVQRADGAVYETDEPVLYAVVEGVASVTLNRPTVNNAQNSQMTYALDDAFRRAVNDDAVKVIVLRANGKHFSWWDHTNKPGGEYLYAREQEVYLGMCRRWRELPKPTIAMVQGACIAGGLMLAWVCDLIVASDDAFFQDPVVRMGIPGVEYFAHPYELNPRIAKEFLFTGDRMSAERAYQMGMVNRLFSREALEAGTYALATAIARQPRMGLALTKQAINHVEDLQGKRTAMDAVFAWHHFAHSHNELLSGDKLGGFDAKAMAEANKAAAGER